MAIRLARAMKLISVFAGGLVAAAPQQSLDTPVVGHSLHIPLHSYFNNAGFARQPGQANFDQLNNSYPAAYLPTGGKYTSTQTGVSYLFPGYQGYNASDNVVMAGQEIPVPAGSYFSANLLVAADSANTAGNLTFSYSDNSSVMTEVGAEPYTNFLTLYKGEIILPAYLTHNDTNFNTSHIYEYIAPLDSSKSLASITLPDTSALDSRLHIFALSLWQGSGIQVQYVRPTQKFTGERVQVVELVVNNAGPEWISGEGVEISIQAPGILTLEPAKIVRLRPGDQKKVNVGVIGCGNVSGHVVFKSRSSEQVFKFKHVTFGLEDFTSDLSSLTKHESPEWFDNAKFGIFIHWGPFSVPAWGNSTPYEVYAEWYWYYGHHAAADTKADIYDYHLRTYGPNVVYDDFLKNLTAEKFDPKGWVDLFADAGAQYFVQTTKHHDGFAMFDTKETTHRNAVHYGPKRDLLKELFDAAKTYQPQLHRGTYFSLPEWYNPDFAPYGFAQGPGNSSLSWPGILARNPYTGETEPYTGRLNISDFITDLMVPQMELLAYEYETEIMWCDCGAANGSAEFASSWFNRAAAQGRAVTMNSRCGIPEGADFDTPEYTTFSSVSQRKWESNMGMDPYSYGYNRATDDHAYMNASTIVTSLVDMVSKNGNFLLDVGPEADGTIKSVEERHLREAGTWIKANGEAIFNTTYWFMTSESGSLRFTQTQDAFYILSLEKPRSTLFVDVPLPLLPGDQISAIGAGKGTMLDWSIASNGSVAITVPPVVTNSGKYCWVFKIHYSAS